MTLDLLVCPGCRTLTGDRLDVRTLERAGDVLACECGRRYPVVDDVPIVIKEPSAYVRSDHARDVLQVVLEAVPPSTTSGNDFRPVLAESRLAK